MGRLINKSPLSNNTFNLETVNFVNDYKGPRGDYNISTKDVTDENGIVVSQELYVTGDSVENVIYLPEDIQPKVRSNIYTFDISDTELLYSSTTQYFGLYHYNKITKVSTLLDDAINGYNFFVETSAGIICSGLNSGKVVLYRRDGTHEVFNIGGYNGSASFSNITVLYHSSGRNYVAVVKDDYIQKITLDVSNISAVRKIYITGDKILNKYAILSSGGSATINYILDLDTLSLYPLEYHTWQAIFIKDRFVFAGYYNKNPYIYIYDMSSNTTKILDMPTDGSSSNKWYNYMIPTDDSFLLTSEYYAGALQGLYLYNGEDSFNKIYDYSYEWTSATKFNNGYLITGASTSSGKYAALFLDNNYSISEVTDSTSKHFNKRIWIQDKLLLGKSSDMGQTSGVGNGLYTYDELNNSIITLWAYFSGWNIVKDNFNGTYDISSNVGTYNKAILTYNPNTNTIDSVKWKVD